MLEHRNSDGEFLSDIIKRLTGENPFPKNSLEYYIRELELKEKNGEKPIFRSEYYTP